MNNQILTIILVLVVLYIWKKSKTPSVSQGGDTSTSQTTVTKQSEGNLVASEGDLFGISTGISTPDNSQVPNISSPSQPSGGSVVTGITSNLPTQSQAPLIPTSTPNGSVLVPSDGGELLHDIVLVPNQNTPMGQVGSLSDSRNPLVAVTGSTFLSGNLNKTYPVATEVTLSWADVQQLQFNGIVVPDAVTGRDYTFTLPANSDPTNYFHALMTGQILRDGSRAWYTSLDYASMAPATRARFTNLDGPSLAAMTRGVDAEKKFYAPTFGPWV